MATTPEINEEALDRIQTMLHGKEWDAGTIEDVAEIVRSTGRVIGPPVDDDEYEEYPSYPCPDDPDGLHSVGCGCEF